MKINISKGIRKYLIIYLALLLGLYLVIVLVPKVTDIFETTQILEPGELVLTDDVEGYVIKEEAISICPKGGDIMYLVDEGTAVRKNQMVVKIQYSDENDGPSGNYDDVLAWLAGYEGAVESELAPSSGLFCLSMDGAEKVLNPQRLDELTYEKVKNLALHARDLRTDTVTAGDPMYKITNDNRWYIVSWMKKSMAKNYSEGQQVKLQLPAGRVAAAIQSISKEDKRYKVVFTSTAYYSELPVTRQVEMTIEGTERSGLLVDNECIIKKDGQEGVYVRDKNGDYKFVRVNVMETDGHESVISETSYQDFDSGETVYTVSVYDEVTKTPEKELKKELKEKEKEKTGG